MGRVMKLTAMKHRLPVNAESFPNRRWSFLALPKSFIQRRGGPPTRTGKGLNKKFKRSRSCSTVDWGSPRRRGEPFMYHATREAVSLRRDTDCVFQQSPAIQFIC